MKQAAGRWLRLIVMNTCVFVVLADVALRCLWANPYISPYPNTSLHHPQLDFAFHQVHIIDPHAPPTVRFRTSSWSYVQSTRTVRLASQLPAGDYAIALGGSTTECALLPEDSRWPDLVRWPTLNYGKSRLDSADSLVNLRFLTETKGLRPRIIFILDGVNNLSHLLQRGLPLPGPHYRHQYGAWWQDRILRHVYVAAFAWKFLQRGDYREFYRDQVVRNLHHDGIDEIELQRYWQAHQDEFRRQLHVLYSHLHAVTERAHAVGIVLTQPHAYQESFQPALGQDLRTFPVIQDRRLSLQQSRWLFDQFNALTRKVARTIGLLVIDTAACLAPDAAGELFYDAVHLTMTGARRFAECVNGELAVLRLRPEDLLP